MLQKSIFSKMVFAGGWSSPWLSSSCSKEGQHRISSQTSLHWIGRNTGHCHSASYVLSTKAQITQGIYFTILAFFLDTFRYFTPLRTYLLLRDGTPLMSLFNWLHFTVISTCGIFKVPNYNNYFFKEIMFAWINISFRSYNKIISNLKHKLKWDFFPSLCFSFLMNSTCISNLTKLLQNFWPTLYILNSGWVIDYIVLRRKVFTSNFYTWYVITHKLKLYNLRQCICSRKNTIYTTK